MSANQIKEFQGNDDFQKQQKASEKKDERWKGVVYINIYGILLALCILLASFVYRRNESIEPEQLLFLRSIISTLMCVIIVNKNIKYVMIDSIPVNQMKNMFFLCLAAGAINSLELTIVKYLTLVFQGAARNLTPIVTVIMSALWTGEKFKTVDIVFLVVSLAGVSAITYGFSFKDDQEEKSNSSNFLIGLAIFGAFMVPILTSYTNILRSKLKNLHENALSCYINPSVGIFSLFIIFFKQEFGTLYELILKFEFIDWLLLSLIALFQIMFQTFKYKALQYDEPGKLGQYQYLISVYQLIFDLFIFNRSFYAIQWIGFIILFVGYSIKFTHVYYLYNQSQKNKEQKSENFIKQEENK